MFKILGNIFSSIRGKDVLKQIDEWGLSKEELIKYKLEWLRNMPSGFQLAQRFIGIAYTIVTLIMILVTFTMYACGLEVEHLKLFIVDTCQQPMNIIFALFFGGGVIDSIKRGKNEKK